MNFVKSEASCSVPSPATRTHRRPFTLVHLTDFHLCQVAGVPLKNFINKRAIGYLSWRVYRGRENHPEVLTTVVKALKSLTWDQVVVTGDLTHLGLPTEFQLARRFLKQIGKPHQVFVIPGNHDALVSARQQSTFGLWADYSASDGENRRASDMAPPTYPTIRIRANVALIGVSTARPTWPFSAAGSMGSAQGRRLAELLATTTRQGLFRVVLLHHPLLPGQVSRRKGLRDVLALSSILEQYGAELVLHGHVHRDLRGYLPGPFGRIPVWGLPSTSADHPSLLRRARLRMFSIHDNGDSWQVNVRDHLYTAAGKVVAQPEAPCIHISKKARALRR